jgi:hypothetical protein
MCLPHLEGVRCLHSDMPSLLQRYNKLRQEHLLFQYFTLVFGEWQTILGGAAVLVVLWSIWFYTGNPPAAVNWIVVIIVLFFAGYKVWRADHIRLIPRLDVAETRLEDMQIPLNNHLGYDVRTFCQLVPKCLTESPVYECVGHLTEVRRWSKKNDWEITDLGPMILRWGNRESREQEITLHPGAENVLNVCYIRSSDRQVCPYGEADITWEKVYSTFIRQSSGVTEAYQFDICLTYSQRVNGHLESVKPINVCLAVDVTDKLRKPRLDLRRR